MRFELRVAEAEPGREHLDVEEFHKRPSLYTLSLLIGSANLQVLAVLPWKERIFSGMPSERMLRATYVSLTFGDLPQLCLQNEVPSAKLLLRLRRRIEAAGAGGAGELRLVEARRRA